MVKQVTNSGALIYNNRKLWVGIEDAGAKSLAHAWGDMIYSFSAIHVAVKNSSTIKAICALMWHKVRQIGKWSIFASKKIGVSKNAFSLPIVFLKIVHRKGLSQGVLWTILQY